MLVLVLVMWLLMFLLPMAVLIEHIDTLSDPCYTLIKFLIY